MHIISILSDVMQRLRASENIALPAWQRHLDTMSQRQLADLVIPPEKLETCTGQYADASTGSAGKTAS